MDATKTVTVFLILFAVGGFHRGSFHWGTGGHVFDPRLGHAFPRIDDSHCNKIRPLSPLIVVSTMVMWESSQWLGENIVQSTVDAFGANFRRDTPLQNRQSIHLIFQTADRQPIWTDLKNLIYNYLWNQGSKFKRVKRSWVDEDFVNRASSFGTTTTTTTSTTPPPPST